MIFSPVMNPARQTDRHSVGEGGDPTLGRRIAFGVRLGLESPRGGNVAVKEAQPIKTAPESLPSRFVDVNNGHRRARAQKRLRDTTAYAVRAAGDDNVFVWRIHMLASL